MSNYKMGLCEWLLPVTGPAALTLAGELGFDGVQILDLGGAEQNYPLNIPRVQELYRTCAEEAGIEIHTLQLQALVRSGKIKCAPGSAGHKDAIEAVRKGVKACTAIGIKRLMVENFFDSAIQNDYDIENTAMFLRQAGLIAADAGIQLIYESFLPVEKTLRIYEMCNRSFKLCYDILNPLRYGFGDPRDELECYPLDMIDHIHLKDAQPDFDWSARLGEGRGHFNEVSSLLKQKGYSDWLISENYYCLGRLGRDYDPLESAAADLATMKSVFCTN